MSSLAFTRPTPRASLAHPLTLDQLLKQVLGAPSLQSVASNIAFPVRIDRRPEHDIVRAELPGVLPEQIDVHVENQVLRIEVNIPESDDNKKWGIISGTRRYEIHLSEDVEAERIQAELKNGVLMLTVPKRAPVVKRLAIEVK